MRQTKNRELPSDKSGLRDGLAGIMRVKNDARFVPACVASCIDALDELVIVYNDCTDATPEVVEHMRLLHPGKIRVFPYPHHVLSTRLTPEEFDQASHLPEDDPRLFSTLCNFALAQVTYRFAMLIDPDQLYFSERIRAWRNVCAGVTRTKWRVAFILAWGFMLWFSCYRRLSAHVGRPCLWMLPAWLVRSVYPHYEAYALWRLRRGTACLSMSGINVFESEGQWFVPFDGVNNHPPYNGTSDHLLYQKSGQVCFVRRIDRQSVPPAMMECFLCPYKLMFVGTVWFHLHANRAACAGAVQRRLDERPELFEPVRKFARMPVRRMERIMKAEGFPLFERTLFAYVHHVGCHVWDKYVGLLLKK